MENNEIENNLALLHSTDFPFDDFNNRLKEEKQRRLNLVDEEGANQIWVCQAICRVHQCYREMFKLLKQGVFYCGWCSLVDASETLQALGSYGDCSLNLYDLNYVLERIRDIQLVFPYVWFTSVAINSDSTQCTICNRTVSFRNSCGHVPGTIYEGKMCGRRMVNPSLDHLAFTKTPKKLKMVAIEEGRDHHNYDAVRELFKLLETPYENWDLRNNKQVFAKNSSAKYGRNQTCFCGSGKKYKKCHLNNNGNQCFRHDLFKDGVFVKEITVFKHDKESWRDSSGKISKMIIMTVDEEWE